LLQGHDSVELRADIEIGGHDQKFNLLVGRELQKQEGQAPQAILTMPLLVGLDGEKKMSKSLNNYIAIQDTPEMMFGKIMSISDHNLWSYIELLSKLSSESVKSLKEQVQHGLNPRDIKMQFGHEMVEQFYDTATADAAKQRFIDKYQQKKVPELPITYIHYNADLKIANLLKDTGMTQSTSESMRLLKQGAVKINGEKLDNNQWTPERNIPYLIQVGKHKALKVQIE
jgi:tyrosyl-tRNA synthetase